VSVPHGADGGASCALAAELSALLDSLQLAMELLDVARWGLAA
jgi:hypothetical protein